jgi:tetratricopeptide (TPR) repeat protein
MQKMKYGIYKIFFSLGLLAAIIIAFYILNFPKKFKLSEADLAYKFELSNTTKQNEFEIARNKVLTEKLPNLADVLLLAELYVSEAKKTGNNNYYNEADKLALSAEKTAPKGSPLYHQALNVRASVMIARHQFAEALVMIDRSDAAAKSPETSSLKILIYLAQNNFEAAFSEVNYLIKANPSMGSATLKALTLSHLGQDDLAFHYFKRALQIEDIGEESQSVITRAQFAQFLIKKGRYDDAIKLCDIALGIIPTNAFAKHVKASALNAKKKYQQAYVLLNEAFAQTKDPAYLLQMVYSLKLLDKTNDFNILSAEAIKIFKTEIEQKSYGHLADLAALYYITGDYTNSIKIISQDQQTKKTLRTDLLLAKNLIQTKKLEAARDLLESQIAKNTTDVTVYYLMLEMLTENHNKNLRKIYLARARLNNENFNQDMLMKIP